MLGVIGARIELGRLCQVVSLSTLVSLFQSAVSASGKSVQKTRHNLGLGKLPSILFHFREEKGTEVFVVI